MSNARNIWGWIVVAATLWTGGHVRAEGDGLGPEDVLVVANRYDRESVRVADHYMQARGIPEGQRLDVSVPIKTTISRQRYNQYVRGHIRDYLIDRELRDQIRCIVLSYNMPLRVSGPPPSRESAQEKERLKSAWGEAVEEIESRLAAVERIARPGDDPPDARDTSLASKPPPEDETSPQKESTAKDSSPKATLKEAQALAGRVSEVLEQAQKRVAELPAPDRSEAAERLLVHRVALVGVIGSWEQLQVKIVSEGSPGRLREVYEQFKGADLALSVLQRHSSPAAREEADRLRRRSFGLVSMVGQYALDLFQTRSGGMASLDGELGLLWWDDYRLAGRLPNTGAYTYERVREFYPEPPVLIVARLDAIDAATAIRMIDDAVAVEKAGLRGRVYLDARGITDDNGYREYDRSLVNLAERLKEATGAAAPVDEAAGQVEAEEDPGEPGQPITAMILDERGEVMAPHSGREAALYCGWYAVRKFNDPLEFVRGAVGYHIASFEATNFSAKTSEWVPNLLRSGCAVSLGPVAEPYLDAFPLPEDFFPLLLTGRHTVGEVFLMTKKYNSWMMVLCGDPLYNPFKNAPVLREDQVQLARRVYQPPSERAIEHAQELVHRVLGDPRDASSSDEMP